MKELFRVIIIFVLFVILIVNIAELKLIENLGNKIAVIGVPVVFLGKFIAKKLFDYEFPIPDNNLSAIVASSLIYGIIILIILKITLRLLHQGRNKEKDHS